MSSAFARHRPRLTRWAVVLLLIGATLSAGYFLWLRDSSLVAVENVEVRGLELPGGERARAALEAEARTMTTLNVREDDLRAAVADDPRVADLDASPELWRGLVIEVTERRPVLLATAGREVTPIADDGTVMRGLTPEGLELPRATLTDLPAERVERGAGLELVGLAAGVPDELLPEVEEIAEGPEGAYLATLTGGIEVRLGDAGRASDKWRAAAAVLADPSVEGLSYLDVSAPSRPALG